MDLLYVIKNDPKLEDKIRHICDFEPFHDFCFPNDLDGKMKWNLQGKAFGIEGSGGEFVLLEDGSVALNGSEGETGRLAENMKEFFELLLNCPCFFDFLDAKLYQDEALLRNFAQKMEQKAKEDFNSSAYFSYGWNEAKKEIALALGLTLDHDIASHTMQKFYRAATRDPQYQMTYADEKGEIISGPLIE